MDTTTTHRAAALGRVLAGNPADVTRTVVIALPDDHAEWTALTSARNAADVTVLTREQYLASDPAGLGEHTLVIDGPAKAGLSLPAGHHAGIRGLVVLPRNPVPVPATYDLGPLHRFQQPTVRTLAPAHS